MIGDMGENIEMGDRGKEVEWWKGSHCKHATSEGLERWVEESGFKLGLKRQGGVFCRTMRNAAAIICLATKGRCLHLLCLQRAVINPF